MRIGQGQSTPQDNRSLAERDVNVVTFCVTVSQGGCNPTPGTGAVEPGGAIILSAASVAGKGPIFPISIQSQVHGVYPQLTHDLRSDISERDEFFGKILKLGADLTQRGFRHDGIDFFRCRIRIDPLR